jgi:hypothetical protein
MVKASAAVFVVFVVAFAAAPRAAAQSFQAPISNPLQPPATMELSGPRVGMTVLSQGVLDKVGNDYGQWKLSPVISQFGWQKEKRFYANPDGLTGVSEFVFLIGGVEQGVFIPSVSWLVGVRSANGVEFAVGPNLTPFGAALAVAGGVTFRSGNLNFPVNLAVVPSKSGMRVSVLAGFNARR